MRRVAMVVALMVVALSGQVRAQQCIVGSSILWPYYGFVTDFPDYDGDFSVVDYRIIGDLGGWRFFSSEFSIADGLYLYPNDNPLLYPGGIVEIPPGTLSFYAFSDDPFGFSICPPLSDPIPLPTPTATAIPTVILDLSTFMEDAEGITNYQVEQWQPDSRFFNFFIALASLTIGSGIFGTIKLLVLGWRNR